MALRFMHKNPHLLIKEGIYEGYRWTICHNNRGYYCAYILLENTHDWVHKPNTEIPCPVHGGINYKENDIHLKHRISIHELNEMDIISYTDSTSPNYIPINTKTGKPLSTYMRINPKVWIGWHYCHALDAPNIDLILIKSNLPMTVKETLIKGHKAYPVRNAKQWNLETVETECLMACESAYLIELQQRIEHERSSIKNY